MLNEFFAKIDAEAEERRLRALSPGRGWKAALAMVNGKTADTTEPRGWDAALDALKADGSPVRSY